MIRVGNTNHPRLSLPKHSKKSPRSSTGDPMQARMKHPRLPNNPRFQGVEEGITRHTYNLEYTQLNIYVKTTKALLLFVGKTYKNGEDIKKSIDQLVLTVIPRPDELPTVSPAVTEVLEAVRDLTTYPPIHGMPYQALVPEILPLTQREERISTER